MLTVVKYILNRFHKDQVTSKKVLGLPLFCYVYCSNEMGCGDRCGEQCKCHIYQTHPFSVSALNCLDFALQSLCIWRDITSVFSRMHGARVEIFKVLYS